MIDTSNWLGSHWIVATAGIVGLGVGTLLFLRSDRGLRTISRCSVRVPVFGKLVRNIALARVCRIWGQLLDSKVGLLDAVNLTQDSTSSLDFKELMGAVATAITEGLPVSTPMVTSWLVPKTFSAAIVTGEESGKLGDALLFVAGCLEEDNAELLNSLSKTIEPILLSVMGLIVGTVAISLFMPMFDLATIAGKG